MSIREQIKERSAGLVLREAVTLPECGIEVQVKGLMSGEAERAGNAKRPTDVQVALGTEDPATGKLIWNPNSREDLDEISGLHMADKATLLKAIDRLSGGERLKKIFSPSETSFDSTSPSGSDEVSTS